MIELSTLDIFLRLVASMAIGIVIGGQRARTGHPAGLRTHMLVSLGACVVMITSCILYQDTVLHYGATPSDPGRLGAQVISGVGFLGAGTIIRDGVSVRGLTTAASLWAVACLGLAAGMGYYKIVLLGTLCLFATLSFFDALQARMRYGNSSIDLRIECTSHMDDVLVRVDSLCKQFFVITSNLSFTRTSGNAFVIRFRAKFPNKDFDFAQGEFTRLLAQTPGVVSLENADQSA